MPINLYKERISECLNTFSAIEVSDFDKIRGVLKKFLNRISIREEASPELKGRIQALEWMYHYPQGYVQKEFCEDFKILIIEQVKKKIKEIKSLTNEDKVNAIDKHKNVKAQMKATDSYDAMCYKEFKMNQLIVAGL